MEKSYTADSFKITGGLGTKVLLDNGTTTDYVTGGTSSPITIENTLSLFSTGLVDTGLNATGANYSNFFGQYAGYEAINANNSNFFGYYAGINATYAETSNFFGYRAGRQATNASNSNFFGQNTGFQAVDAYSSNFFGPLAGYQATYANNSNFFGDGAGQNAANANNSNFIGTVAGINATNAYDSNFIGTNAGQSATNAFGSNFIGFWAGNMATNASYSNLFGYNVGRGQALGSLGSNNIIIGTNISLSAGTTNSINIGGVLFGTGTYSTTTGNPSITAQTTTGKIGINVVTPLETLHVNGPIKIGSNTYTGLSSGATSPVPNGGAGTIVFDSVSTEFYGWNGTMWKPLSF